MHLSIGKGKPKESSVFSDSVDKDWAGVSIVRGSKDIGFGSVVGVKGENTGDLIKAGGSSIGVESGGGSRVIGVESRGGNTIGTEARGDNTGDSIGGLAESAVENGPSVVLNEETSDGEVGIVENLDKDKSGGVGLDSLLYQNKNFFLEQYSILL